jgi:ATP-dependent DNA ligase
VPRVAAALRALPAASVTLDGEAVVYDERGIADFDQLRAALAQRAPTASAS